MTASQGGLPMRKMYPRFDEVSPLSEFFHRTGKSPDSASAQRDGSSENLKMGLERGLRLSFDKNGNLHARAPRRPFRQS
jgi:hypothetical protein